METQRKISTIYVVKPEFISLASEELGDNFEVIEDLVLSSQKMRNICFALDVWLEPEIATFQSISEATNILRKAGRFWHLHPIYHVRRSRLIEEQLRKCPPLARHFPIDAEIQPIGSFSLIDKNTLVYSAKRTKKWPEGKCFFIEDKTNPPNRAYLKLWEALTLLGKRPKMGEQALDLGASPGGWTYVMQSLGATVTAVDKALLDPKVMRLPGVQFLKQSAFAIEPATLEKTYDWVLSDIACYPDRALALIKKWIESGKAKQMIFTIKLQGATTLATIKQFQTIPNSCIMHLFYNKHEMTFFYPPPATETAKKLDLKETTR